MKKVFLINSFRSLLIGLICIIFISALSSNTTQKEEFSADDKVQIKSILEGKESANWVFTGNSITQGAKHTHGMRAYPEIFSERIRWEMQDHMILLSIQL